MGSPSDCLSYKALGTLLVIALGGASIVYLGGFLGKCNMKNINKYFSIGIAIVLVAFVLFLTLSASVPAFSATLSRFVSLVSTPTPPPGAVIPLKPIAGLTSLNATVNIEVDGLINGNRAQGDLNAVLTTNDKKMSQITVSGSLLGDIVAQVGGSLVSLFTPSKVDIYKVPGGTYIVINGLFPVCVKPEAAQATKALDDMSPQALLSMLTSSDVARGKLVGEETLNGAAVKHYVINGDAFIAAARKSKDPKHAPLPRHYGPRKTPTCISMPRAATRLHSAAAIAANTSPSNSKAISMCKFN